MNAPTEVPFELRARIAAAEESARRVLASARVLARQSRDIDRTLEELNRLRGGDDAAFDRLAAVTNPLTRLENEIADTVMGMTGTPWGVE